MADYTLEEIYSLLKDPKNNLHTKISYSNLHKTNNRAMTTTIGKVWFSLLLPVDYPFVKEQVNKKKLNVILNDIANKYNTQTASDTLTKINKEGFYLTTINPISFDKDSFNVPPELKKRAKELLDVNLPPEKFVENINILGNEYLEWLKATDNGLYYIVASGAKFNASELGTLLFAAGPFVGIDGVISKPTKGCVNDGYNLEDWYRSSDQSRYTLFVRAVGTAEPGALGREVCYSNSNIQLDPSSDCKVKKYLELTITNSIRPIINGRYYLNEKTNNLEIINEETVLPSNSTIKLRSPIYCKQPNNNICSICYGTLGDRLNTKNIGLLSGTIINLAGIQGYSMKLRHQSSQVNLIPVDFKKQMILI